jgi:hypothetical protein
MRHFYILMHDVKIIGSFIKTLRKMGVARDDVHVVRKDDHRRELYQIADLSIFETTDLVPSLLRGALLGGLVVFVTTSLFIRFNMDFNIQKEKLLLMLCLIGTMLGAWASSLIGISVINPEIKKIEEGIDRGEVMVLIDVSNEKEIDLLNYIKSNYPNLTIQVA